MPSGGDRRDFPRTSELLDRSKPATMRSSPSTYSTPRLTVVCLSPCLLGAGWSCGNPGRHGDWQHTICWQSGPGIKQAAHEGKRTGVGSSFLLLIYEHMIL